MSASATYPTNVGSVLWRQTSAPAPKTEALSGRVRCDVAVIGGGYTGLSCALHLAERGVNVGLVEAGEIGEGASGLNAGHCTPLFQHYSLAQIRHRFGPLYGDRIIALQTQAGHLVFDIIRRFGIDCEAVSHGFLQVAHAPRRMDAIHDRHRDYEAIGCRVRLVEQAEAEYLTGSPRFFGGWIFEEAGHLNPLGYARGLARAAMQSGARLHTRSPARAIAREHGGWSVATDHGALVAERVVIATGAYSGDIWPGLSAAFLKATVACIASRPLGPQALETLLPNNNHVLDTRGDFTNFRLDKDGRLITSVLVGGRRGGDPASTMRKISDRYQWLFPSLPRLDWEHCWWGDIDVHPDTFPQLADLAPGVASVLGYSSRGVPTATALGRQAALDAMGASADELAIEKTALRSVPKGFALAFRVLPPFYRLRDAFQARLDRVDFH